MTKLKLFDMVQGWSFAEVPDRYATEDEMFIDWIRKLGGYTGESMDYARDDGATACAYPTAQSENRGYGYIVHIEICGNAETILCSGMVDVMEFMRVHSFEYVGE